MSILELSRLFGGLTDPLVVSVTDLASYGKKSFGNREIEEILFLRNRGRSREAQGKRNGKEEKRETTSGRVYLGPGV